jgi:hypothetical protein
MRRTFIFALAFFATQSCIAPKRMPLESMDAPEASVPIFPCWTCESFKEAPPADGAPSPRFTAVLVAKGYLAIPFPAALGKPADYFDKEPCVWMLIGRSWRKAEMVAMDGTLALVKADVRAAPWPLAEDAGPASLVIALRSGPPGGLAMDTAPRCSAISNGSDPQAERLICGDEDGLLPGAAVLGADGRLLGLVNHVGGDAYGPTAPAIRDFLDEYFASWGRHVTPRPTY